MDFSMSKENISVNEVIFNGGIEQTVELDYVLPDYCPEIFKILKSQITGKVLSTKTVANKLTIDGVAYIKILYIGENPSDIKALEQKQNFTKTIELKSDGTNAAVIAKIRTDYVNCRAVNQRRLDIKGALTITVTVTNTKTIPIIVDCNNVQLHKNEVSVCSQKLCAVKDFTVKDELMIGQGKPAISDILSYEAVALSVDSKILANKVVVKGEVLLNTLYLPADNSGNPEIMEHKLQISQIVDLAGIDEDYICNNILDITKYDIDLQVDDDDRCNSFIVELGIKITCEACINKTVQVVDDCYSTNYETVCSFSDINLDRVQKAINQNIIIKKSVKLNQNNINSICDLSLSAENVTWQYEDDKIGVMCNLKMSMLAFDNDNIPLAFDQLIPCELSIDDIKGNNNIKFEPNITVYSAGYTIMSVDEIEIRAELIVSGIIYENVSLKYINEVTVDEQSPKSRKDNSALRLYFADENESIWDIAKRYNTSVDAILEENSLESQNITARGMILIPIVD